MATATVTTDTDRYLPTPEAAEYIGLGIWGIRAAANEGRLHPIKLPGHKTLMYDVEELNRFLAAKRRAAPGGTRSSSALDSGSGIGPQAEAGSLVTPQDAMNLATLIFDRGTIAARDIATGAASGAAEATARHVMGPIAEAIRPLVQSYADASQAPAVSATDVERVMSAVRFEAAQLLVRLVDALRPLIEAQAQGRRATTDDTRPIIAFMQDMVGKIAGLEDGPQMQELANEMRGIVERMTRLAESGQYPAAGQLTGTEAP